MKKNQINKPVWALTIFITMLFSCQKDLSPDNPKSLQSAENLSTEEVLNEENLTRSLINSVTMPTPIEGLRIFAKNPIPFVPFEMVDQNGVAIFPNKVLTLKSGNKITAQAYFTRLNIIEKKLNEFGFTLRNNQPIIASETVTESEYLDGMILKEPQSIGDLLTDRKIDSLMNPVRRVGSLWLKPMGDYSVDEKKTLERYFFQESGDSIIAIPISAGSSVAARSAAAELSVLLKTITKKDSREWSYGKKSTLKVTISGEIIRGARIYRYDPKNPDKCLTEVNVTSKSKIDGAVFGNTLSLYDTEVDFFAPTSTERKMTARMTMNIAGINVYNLGKSYSTKTVIEGDKSKSINKSFSIQVPIFWGLQFTGKIGVVGRAGLKYRTTLNQGYVNAQVTPYSSIKGFVEAGVSFVGVIGGGVGSELEFLNGNIALRGSMVISNMNSSQTVLLGTDYYGYDLLFLKGRLYCYVEACIKWFGCFRPVEHTFFSWQGYRAKGTLSLENNAFTIANH